MQYAITICNVTAYPRKQWLRESTSMLRYMQVVCRAELDSFHNIKYAQIFFIR